MRCRTSDLFAAAGFLSFAVTAGAQTSTAPEPSADNPAVGLEEIVVTARRKEESIEDVPQVVDAVTADALARFNIQSFQDVAALVPGLTLSNDGTGYQAKAALRGVNFEVNSATSPTVQFYMNEAPIDANFLLQSMFDVGQIEVLRGPQGTLRGRSAPSGAITVTTHKADLSGLGGYAAVTGTDRKQIKADGAFNLPIVKDMLAIRLAGMIDDNEFDHIRSLNNPADPHQHTSAERLSLLFQPSDGFTLDIAYQHLERKLRSYTQVAGAGAPGNVPSNPCFIQSGAASLTQIPCPPPGYNGPTLTPQDRLAVEDAPWPVTAKYDVVTGQAEYRFAGQKLTYVGGYSKLKVHSPAPTDTANMLPGGAAVYQTADTRQSQVSHELRVASEERIANLFDYTAGVFYSLEKPQIQVSLPVAFLSGAFGTPLGLPNPSSLDDRYLINALTSGQGRREERSAFASVTWHIDDKTELTGGARYILAKDTELTDTFLNSVGLIALPAAITLPPGVTCTLAGLPSTYPGTCDFPSAAAVPSAQVLHNASDRRWTPKVYNASISRHFTDELLGYLTYGTAWRRGPTAVGIQNATNDAVLNRFVYLQPETSKGWELGLKSTFLDKRARVNVAVYRQTFNNFIYLTPLVSYLADTGTGPTPQTFQFTTNVPATVKGLDLDGSLQLTKRWNVGMAFSYSDGHMEGASIPCNAPIPAAQHVALCTSNNAVTTAPTWNANLQSEYWVPITSSMDSYVRGLFTYYPKNDRASGQGSGFTADAYGILNLYAGIRQTEGAWDVQLFVRNLTDTKKALTFEQAQETNNVSGVNMSFGQSGYYRTSVTPLREFGITARYAFGSH